MTPEEYRKWRAGVIESKGGCCIRCGSRSSLELCRFDGGGGQRTPRIQRKMALAKLEKEAAARELYCTTCRKRHTPHPTNNSSEEREKARYRWFSTIWLPEARRSLGGKCAVCDSVEHLEVDHIHAQNKSFEISRGYKRSEEALGAELQKCQLLCRPCHILKTANERHR